MSIFDDIKESVENFIKEKTTKYNNSSKWKETVEFGMSVTLIIKVVIETMQGLFIQMMV